MKSARIVLIEDNPADILLVRKALEENGIAHSLTTFECGEEAIRILCAEAKGEVFVPDAILLDLSTPGMDGFELLHRFRGFPRFSQLPIAILTSSRDRRDKHRAALHSTRYIEKPTQLNEFLTSVGRAVREMLEGSGVPLA